MYARRLKCRIQKWDSLRLEFWNLSRLSRRGVSQSSYSRCSPQIDTDPPLRDSLVRKFCSPAISPWRQDIFSSRYSPGISYNCCRFYSSEGDGSSASGGKHVPVKDATNFDKESTSKEETFSDSNRCNEHAWLGEQDQLDWLNCEKLSIDSKRKECPFLTKRERFKNEFMRRVVPWDKIKVSWDKFPYHIR